MIQDFTILLEEDFASNNFSAYIPELRLSVVGETEEETLTCAKDLIKLELERKPNHKRFNSKVVIVQVDVNVDSKNFPTAV